LIWQTKACSVRLVDARAFWQGFRVGKLRFRLLLLVLGLQPLASPLAADLAVDLFGEPANGIVQVGDVVSLSLRLANLGPDAVQPTIVVMGAEVNGLSFPEPTDVCEIAVGQINPPISPTSYAFSWFIRNPADAGASLNCPLRFRVMALPDGQIPVHVRLAPFVSDANPANNSATFTFRGSPLSPVSVPAFGFWGLVLLVVSLSGLAHRNLAACTSSADLTAHR
jgi:hypothetical protein